MKRERKQARVKEERLKTNWNFLIEKIHILKKIKVKGKKEVN